MIRQVQFEGKVYQVNRLYSSGLGEQFAVTFKEEGGSATGVLKTILLTEQVRSAQPHFAGLYARCLKLFSNRTIFNGGDSSKSA